MSKRILQIQSSKVSLNNAFSQTHQVLVNNESEEGLKMTEPINAENKNYTENFRKKMLDIRWRNRVEIRKEFLQKTMKKLLSKLEKKYSEVLYLYYYEEKNYQQIANITWTNKNTVGTLVSRAKKKIKELAQQYNLEHLF